MTRDESARHRASGRFARNRKRSTPSPRDLNAIDQPGSSGRVGTETQEIHLECAGAAAIGHRATGADTTRGCQSPEPPSARLPPKRAWKFTDLQADFGPTLSMRFGERITNQAAVIEETVMGMVGCFRQISPWLLEQLISKQHLVEPFLLVGFRGELEQSPPQVAAALKNDPFLMEMAQDMELQIRGMAPESADKIIQEASGPALSLDKNWQEIHQILTGNSKPTGDLLSNAILGGADVGADLGYGPARFFTRDQVKQISEKLDSVSEDHFRTSASSFAKDGFSSPQGELERIDFYCELFTRLQAFYRNAAESGCPILLWFS